MRAGRARLQLSLLPIVQCALAAGVAWFVATDIVGHAHPFFAPIAAVVSLGVSLGARMRRSAELVVGVTVGIGVGDLIISAIGSGPWQIALVVALAMSTAVFLDGGPIIAMQAGSSAVLVATLIPPGDSGGIDRMVDALTGGLVGIAIVALIPTHPVWRARKDAARVLGIASDVLQKVADGLVANDPKPIEEALKKARATQSDIDALRTNLKGGREIARISPLYWGHRNRLAGLEKTADPIDNAIRNIRVLARRSLTLVRDDEILDPRVVDEVEKLAQATDVLRRMVLADPGRQPDAAEAARVLRAVAAGAKPELISDAGLSATVVLAQLRSIIVDFLQVAGLKRISALATLPPTVAKPEVTPDLF
ncbi:aromatic acid exporter family protein [Rhodococcus sp. RS1C4]|nr:MULTISPECIES: FUSC family protein [Rhodococcus]OZC48136.1 aromatic acid exporter family protein [Rhodococcus sp. 06-621-2]OZC52106.1 aromatic acid exporter family protein [Rhodococcus sp. RS1C4]OZC91241.1 aromatic acid exporter family protein [Rhodococcus sp. 06-418-1B]OZD15141.1 aromatic acid exporter family protein [Rhodococcus sp. 06-156-4C]OZD19772.1 aromatic acid exporter family protein [Rhodococcus sp. 06-156-4a]